jgi:hypothetical protein
LMRAVKLGRRVNYPANVRMLPSIYDVEKDTYSASLGSTCSFARPSRRKINSPTKVTTAR